MSEIQPSLLPAFLRERSFPFFLEVLERNSLKCSMVPFLIPLADLGLARRRKTLNFSRFGDRSCRCLIPFLFVGGLRRQIRAARLPSR